VAVSQDGACIFQEEDHGNADGRVRSGGSAEKLGRWLIQSGSSEKLGSTKVLNFNIKIIFYDLQ
jgi:hypothetical protein